MLSNKMVFITGAGGFIGSHLAQRVVKEGAKVKAFVRYDSSNARGFITMLPADVRANIEVVRGDIRYLETVRDVISQADVVFHLAALVGVPYSYLHAQEVVETNVMGTLNVLLAALDSGHIEKVVLTSTSEVYGTARSIPIDESHPLQPQSPYAATKVASDALGISFYKSFGLPVVLARPFNTYGPRQSARAIIPTIITQALTRDMIEIGDTSPTRDFTYVTDTVEGFIRLAESDKCLGEAVNFGTGSEINIAGLAARILLLVGRDLPIRTRDERMRPRASEVYRICADNSKAWKLLGWRPQISLDEGLKRTIDWISNALASFEPERYKV